RDALAALRSGDQSSPALEPAVVGRLTRAVGPCFDAASVAALVAGGALAGAAGAVGSGGSGGSGATPTTPIATVPAFDAAAAAIPAALQQLLANLGAATANLPDLSKVNPLTLVDRSAFVASARTN